MHLPAGMPSIGTGVADGSRISRAVPSPPAKRMSATPRARSTCAAARVSAAVVAPALAGA